MLDSFLMKLMNEITFLENKENELKKQGLEIDEQINSYKIMIKTIEEDKKNKERIINGKIEIIKNLVKIIQSLIQMTTIILCVIFSYYLGYSYFGETQIRQILLGVSNFILSSGCFLTMENKLFKKVNNIYIEKIKNKEENQEILIEIRNLEGKINIENLKLEKLEVLKERKIKLCELYQREINIKKSMLNYIENGENRSLMYPVKIKRVKIKKIRK